MHVVQHLSGDSLEDSLGDARTIGWEGHGEVDETVEFDELQWTGIVIG